MDNTFDFLVGTWNSSHRRRKPFSTEPWHEFTGVTRCWSVFDGAGNVDEITFPSEGFSGMTMRLYDAAKDEWSLYWVNSRTGLALPPVVGRFGADGRGVFTGPDVYDGHPIQVVYEWSGITANSCRWQQAFSLDDGATWDTNWTMEFTRTS
jgi:hypothetical protein